MVFLYQLAINGAHCIIESLILVFSGYINLHGEAACFAFLRWVYCEANTEMGVFGICVNWRSLTLSLNATDFRKFIDLCIRLYGAETETLILYEVTQSSVLRT